MKKKFMMALGALAMVLVVAGASVGITIAALQARVESGFNISYTAKNVKAGIVLSCGMLPVSFTTTASEYVSAPDSLLGMPAIIFSGEESDDATKSFEKVDINFEKYEMAGVPNNAYLSFVVANFDNTDLLVKLQEFEKIENIKIEYGQRTRGESLASSETFHTETYDDFVKVGDYLTQNGVPTTFHEYDDDDRNRGEAVSFTDISDLLDAIKEHGDLLKKDADVVQSIKNIVSKYDSIVNKISDTFPGSYNIKPMSVTLEDINNGSANIWDVVGDPNMSNIIIKISIIDPTKDVKFSGNFNFTLEPA